MDPADRIAEEFNRLIEARPKTYAEQVLFFVVVARCEIDMASLMSVFEQALGRDEIQILIRSLTSLGAAELAEEFAIALALLESSGFYPNRNSRVLPAGVTSQFEQIQSRIGDRLWNLDAKLAEFFDAPINKDDDVE
jgi:hypothetical protein